MKRMCKFVAVIVIVCLMLSCGSTVLSVGIDMDETITTGGLNELNVRQAVRNYMDTRASFLLGEIESMDWLVNGINYDETAHKAKVVEESFELRNLSYVIGNIECGDTEAVVAVSETVHYAMNGVVGYENVEHLLYVMLYEDTIPFVAADGYRESISDFQSCSYVDPSTDYAINAFGNTGGSEWCILNVAVSQLGQGEDENGETKYGTMFNAPATEWCAAFICWCAENANVMTTKDNNTAIIYRSAVCDELLNFHVNKGTYFESQSNGGNETPKAGDIMFIGYEKEDKTLDATHVALVEEVVGSTIYYINPNSTDGTVKRLTRNEAGSDILGYGRPAYENSGHTASSYTKTADSHHGICMNCDVSFVETHSFACLAVDSNSHHEICEECNYVISISAHIMGTALCHDNDSHWYECGGCGYRENEQAHTCGAYYASSIGHWKICSVCEEKCYEAEHLYLVDADGTRICRICGYEGPGSVIMKKIGVTL